MHSVNVVNLIAADTSYRRMIQDIEGPTPAQAKKMAATIAEWQTRSAELLAAGHDNAAFELDCNIMDLEGDLIRYGFNTTTGLRTKAK